MSFDFITIEVKLFLLVYLEQQKLAKTLLDLRRKSIDLSDNSIVFCSALVEVDRPRMIHFFVDKEFNKPKSSKNIINNLRLIIDLVFHN